LLLKARIANSKKSLQLEPEEVGNLLLFQYNVGSARFYANASGRVPIRLSESPHALFAKETTTSNVLPEGPAQSVYREFLKASWSALHKAPSLSIDEQIQRFWELVKSRQARGTAGAPIVVTRMPSSNELYIVDGNHRAAIAFALGAELSAHFVPFELVFFRYLSPSEYYGSGHRSRPYQTIYHNQKPVILGRRTDMFQRLDLVPHNLLADSTILDIGSNFGMNALAAAWRGASSVVGLERSSQLTNVATRFAVLNGLYPRVTFRQFDVDTDALPGDEQFDGCFMLSVFQHVQDSRRLLRIAEGHVRKWVIFEGHPGSSYSLYKQFFESGLFDDVTQLGELNHSAADPLTRRRPLWLCTKKRAPH
jgi:hypothetical protein